jgi:hypothetical protein
MNTHKGRVDLKEQGKQQGWNLMGELFSVAVLFDREGQG